MNLYENLCRIIEENNWNEFVEVLKPKDFSRDTTGSLTDKRILAKVAETLTSADANIPEKITIILLKCLVNSCVDGYEHQEYTTNSDNNEHLFQNYCHEIYKFLSKNNSDATENAQYFPYEGIAKWTVDYIIAHYQNAEECSTEQLEILRLSIQFLCNLLTFACKKDSRPTDLNSEQLKTAIMSLIGSENLPLARAACAYIHNSLKQLPNDYYSKSELNNTAEALIHADKLGIHSAYDTILLLLTKPDWLESTYDNLPIESKLHLLDIIYQDLRESVYSERNNERSTNFPDQVVQFISNRFKKRSDLILKTVDSYLKDMEPTEITLLLGIIGVISSKDSSECNLLKNDKSLMINCIFLLKSVHTAGKETENYFTPVQKLSEIASCIEGAESSESNIQNHPAFGFKAGLIRAIGNLAHKHKGNQELLRETDAIPLLLDCCNIDARNPLIMQWTIFALRNLCENNPENQAIIRNCNKIGIVDSAIIREMGLTLHEDDDGKAIGIIPLPTNK